MPLLRAVVSATGFARTRPGAVPETGPRDLQVKREICGGQDRSAAHAGHNGCYRETRPAFPGVFPRAVLLRGS